MRPGRARERDVRPSRMQRSHSRSKFESDRRRERERQKDRDRGGGRVGARSGTDNGDRDRYKGSLSEGQNKLDKESSDEEVNVNIDILEEDDEERIIELRRKKREELLKVGKHFVFNIC